MPGRLISGLLFVVYDGPIYVYPCLFPALPTLQVLGVDPPRPLPPAAYDLHTALETVQHFATQTLAGVVQAEATGGFDPDSYSGSRSPTRGAARATAAAKEAREAAAAAGSREGWDKLWPPRELTAALGLVTARQMAHTMRCDAEPLIQVRGACCGTIGFGTIGVPRSAYGPKYF